MCTPNIPLFKYCTKCKKEYPCTREYFYSSSTGRYGLDSHCKQCHAEVGKRSYENNRVTRNQKNRTREIKQKIEVLTHYGRGKCACLWCGFDIVAALTLDHIADDGYDDPRSGKILYRYLLKHNFPEGYQTLCMNCQYIKRDRNGNSSKRITC